MTKTELEVDAVLPADVGDAPMRQRQYTAPVHAPSAYAPHAVRRNTTRQQVAKCRVVECPVVHTCSTIMCWRVDAPSITRGPTLLDPQHASVVCRMCCATQ